LQAFTNLNAKDLINQAKTLQILNFGALTMMEDMEQRMVAYLVKKSLTQEESKILNVSMVTITRLSNHEFTALALKLITNAI
jgi:Trp operon repressor